MHRVVSISVTAVAVGATLAVAVPDARADEHPSTVKVTLAYDGEEANESSHFPAVSGDGKVVSFGSNANNIVRRDWNNAQDVFVRDLATGVNTRVSVATDGTAGNGGSLAPSLSHDGRFVAFQSTARNLVPGDTNSVADIFVHDRQTSTTTRVSVATDGTQADAASRDARMSADGRWVVFSTTATNLVPGAVGKNRKVLVHDRQTGSTSEVSVRPDGTSGTKNSEAPTISADGRYVAFLSYDHDIVPATRRHYNSAYVRDLHTGTTVRANTTPLADLGHAIVSPNTTVTVSPDGRYATFFTDGTMVAEDTNNVADAYRYELATGEVVRVSVGTDGVQTDKASGFALSGATLSADGRYIVFDSQATNLVPGDTNDARDIFVRDTVDGTTTRVSIGDGQNTRDSYFPAISADGGLVVFTTDGPLVADDTNARNDVYLHRLR